MILSIDEMDKLADDFIDGEYTPLQQGADPLSSRAETKHPTIAASQEEKERYICTDYCSYFLSVPSNSIAVSESSALVVGATARSSMLGRCMIDVLLQVVNATTLFLTVLFFFKSSTSYKFCQALLGISKYVHDPFYRRDG